MTAYYNEIDKFAAAWLRELIKAGQIAPGDVDERSIEDVKPSDIAGYTQCHFFAGIGVWSYALRQAGWPDDRQVWTGSCPCQPFSTAGKGIGFADERHLWPAYFHLIRECKPDTIFGEQVGGKDGITWLNLVQDDLEGEGYRVGAVSAAACGFGAPHIRKRLYFVGHPNNAKRQTCDLVSGGGKPWWTTQSGLHGVAQGDTFNTGLQGHRGSIQERSPKGWEDSERHGSSASLVGKLAISYRPDVIIRAQQESETQPIGRGKTGGFWGNAEWVYCRDEKYRAIEPSTFPLAHGAPNRVGRLRGYGNAIVAPQAQAFIESYIEACTENGQFLL